MAEQIRAIFSENAEKIKNLLSEKRNHKKDMHCLIEGCKRKYTSKIALRAHLRKNHNFQKYAELWLDLDCLLRNLE